ncbi:hypothetical protein [Paenibacillus thermotolerans]|uniref:hypothetical protein n=1 Tax=Paenibacillus thermotolerans TaxID=3027807 RepID=UPI002368EC96|nr:MULTISPECIES: hypothetical protein [unclassified Paenibacillus]
MLKVVRNVIEIEKLKNKNERLFGDSKSIVWVGLLGIALSLFFLVIIACKSGFVPPDGDLYKPFSFNAALGLFLLNLAAFIPFSGMTGRGLTIWKRSMALSATGAYLIESIQPLRGIDPRFARNGVLSDILIGAVGMSSLSLSIMVLTGILGWKIFRASGSRKLLLYSLRWSMVLIAIGFAIGFIMFVSVIVSDYRDQYSIFNWLAAHGFAFHSLQSFPIVALLLEGRGAQGKKIINVVGVIWVTVMLLLSIQTYLEQSIVEGPIFIANIFLLATYLCILVFSFYDFKRRDRITCYTNAASVKR